MVCAADARVGLRVVRKIYSDVITQRRGVAELLSCAKGMPRSLHFPAESFTTAPREAVRRHTRESGASGELQRACLRQGQDDIISSGCTSA